MEWVESKRGKRKLSYEGYLYTQQKLLADGVISYECERRRNQSCRARVKVLDGEIVGRVHDHTHAPDGRRVDVARIQVGIQRKAKDMQETPQQIITSEVSSISESAAALLPTVRTMRRVIRRHRQQEGIPHPIPQNTQDMEIPEELKVTARGEAFLLYDSGPGGARTLIFSTTRNLELLQAAEAWFADGTFKVVPEIFFQLYTLHVMREGRVIPCVYALLPNKQETTYQAFLSEVLRLKPGSVLVDFEQAAINAFRAVFPNSTLKGCFYHLSQNIYRKVQAVGLQE